MKKNQALKDSVNVGSVYRLGPPVICKIPPCKEQTYSIDGYQSFLLTLLVKYMQK